MAELVEPFERELRRRMLEDAESEYRRRTARPRADVGLTEADLAKNALTAEWRQNPAAFDKSFVPSTTISREGPERGAMTISEMIENPVAEPENPAAVRQELFGGLMNPQPAIRVAAPKPAPPARLTKAGSSTFREDPLTGEWTQVVEGPKVTPKATDFERSQIRLAEDEVLAARRAWEKIPDDKANLDAKIAAKNRQLSAEKRLRRLFPDPAAEPETVAPVAAAIVEEPSMSGFIGDPRGGNNLFTAPSPKQALAADELIAVVNPNGKATKIKAADLERALQQGYQRR